jgi:hypothetical protein
MSDHDLIPDLLLERYRLGELPPAAASALEQRLAVDAEARERLQRIEEAEGEIRRQQPPGWLAAQVRSRVETRRAATAPASQAWPRWAWSASLASAAALALVVLTQRPWPGVAAVPSGRQPGAVAPSAGTGVGTTTGPTASAGAPNVAPVRAEAGPGGTTTSRPTAGAPTAAEGDRLKGLQPSLAVFRRTAAGSETLAEGARTRAGDVVRIGYRSAGRGYGVIVSVDGRGAVAQHLPARGTQAVALQTGMVLLDEAYELDDAPRFERFYLVVAEAPFDVERVLQAARRAAGVTEPRPLELAGAFEQATFSLEKEEAR